MGVNENKKSIDMSYFTSKKPRKNFTGQGVGIFEI